jgi:hypothetical protein
LCIRPLFAFACVLRPRKKGSAKAPLPWQEYWGERENKTFKNSLHNLPKILDRLLTLLTPEHATQTGFTSLSGRKLCPPLVILSTFSRALMVAFGSGSLPWQHSGNRGESIGSRDADSNVENELLWLASLPMKTMIPRTVATRVKKWARPYESQRFRELYAYRFAGLTRVVFAITSGLAKEVSVSRVQWIVFRKFTYASRGSCIRLTVMLKASCSTKKGSVWFWARALSWSRWSDSVPFVGLP